MADWVVYDQVLVDRLVGKVHDFEADTFVMLLTSSSYTPNQATHSVLADITNELSATGYARKTLANPDVSAVSSHSVSWDTDDAVWAQNASGFTTARVAVIFNNSSTSDKVVAYCIFSADKGIVDGPLTVNVADVFSDTIS